MESFNESMVVNGSVRHQKFFFCLLPSVSCLLLYGPATVRGSDADLRI